MDHTKKIKLCSICKKEIKDDGSFEFILVDVCDNPICMVNRRIQIGNMQKIKCK